MKQSDMIKNYTKLDIEILSNEFFFHKFLYKLVKRENHKCIYSQTFLGRVIAYEVFKTKIIPYRENIKAMMFRLDKPIDETLYREYSEKFPSDEEFGKRAWTYNTYEKSLKKYEELG